MATIKDGASGNIAGVNAENQLQTHAVTDTSAQHAGEDGKAWNLNTGDISVTGDGVLMYLKNTSDSDFVIDAIAAGITGGITYSAAPNDKPHIFLVKGPTGGTIVDNAVAIDMNQNRNFGFTDTFGGDVYKGVVGDTITGGDGNVAQLQLSTTGRSFFALGFVIPKQSSIAINLILNAASGTANIYFAIIGNFH